MNVLVADKFESWGIDALRAAGCDVTCEPALEGEALTRAITRLQCAVLIVRSTPVTREALGASGSLALVIRAGAGYNTIDVQAASRAGVLVANCPGKNAVAVAELTFALILALDRRIPDSVVDLRNGVWNKSEYARARGLKGRTLGIIGMGEIGKAVARRAHGFDMRVAAWSRSLTPDSAAECNVARCESPADVASLCDILTIHLAATPQTRGIINADVLNRLPQGAFVINTARAEVLDYAALTAAVKERGLRVGLDVYPDEPTTGTAAFHATILDAGGVVYGTHHIGASTDQAQDAIARETVRIVTAFLETGRVLNCVNVRAATAKWCLTVRHANRPGVLAHVLGALSFAGINVQEMENIIMSGGETACARIHVDNRPPDDVIQRVEAGSESVLAVSLVRGNLAADT